MNPETFWQNRGKIPLAELERHRGNWAAFSDDGSRIIASAPDLEALEQRLAVMGMDPETVVFERIGPDEIILGSIA